LDTAVSERDSIDAGIPFDIATGYGSSAVPERHVDVPRLEKPFDPSEVIELVSRWERLCAD
jgi:hypothetical protein